MKREVSTRDAKDGIAKVVEDAKQGRRTVVLSRRVPIAVIGPIADLEGQGSTARVSTTDIKTGRQSIKGIVARNACVRLTIRGEEVASLRRPPSDLEEDTPTAHRDDRVEELIRLLEETRAIQNQAEHYRKIRACALRLLEHSEDVVKRLPDSYARDQIAQKLEQLRADTLRQ